MVICRLIDRGHVSRLEMLSACSPVGKLSGRPLVGCVCGPDGRIVVASGVSVAELERDLSAVLARSAGLWGGVVEFEGVEGTVRISRITPDHA